MARAIQQGNSSSPALLDEAQAEDFLHLMKPRVMSLVLFTAFIGMLMAPTDLPLIYMGTALIMIALGAGASAALNMWYDADIDVQMKRTQNRPIPQGRVSAAAALNFGMWLSGIAILSMAVMINYQSAALLAFTIFFYVVIYTMWLKRSTAQNIVIGGAAGAFPPVIGWLAAGGTMTVEPWIYFAIIFLWTPPHFWALALIKNEDYKAANIPMLPVVAGVPHTLWQILAYSIGLAICAMLPYYLGFSGMVYALGGGVLSLIFVGLAVMLFFASEQKRNFYAGWLFAYSIFYLFALFALLPLDKFWG